MSLILLGLSNTVNLPERAMQVRREGGRERREGGRGVGMEDDEALFYSGFPTRWIYRSGSCR